MSLYYGVVKGNIVELPTDVDLADGVMVEVRVIESTSQQLLEDQFKQQLVEAGLLKEIKRPTLLPLQIDRTPIQVEGTPLSEMIIKERQ